MKLEIMLTFGLLRFAGSDDDIWYHTGFPCYSTQLVSMNFFYVLPLNELQGLR